MFGSSLRRATDVTMPLPRRVRGLVNAVEQFRLLSFWWALGHLHLATGSAPNEWSSDQLNHAASLLGEAHADWVAFLRRAELESRAAKRRPGYRPLDRSEQFFLWRAQFFDADRRRQWSVGEIPAHPKVARVLSRGFLRDPT